MNHLVRVSRLRMPLVNSVRWPGIQHRVFGKKSGEIPKGPLGESTEKPKLEPSTGSVTDPSWFENVSKVVDNSKNIVKDFDSAWYADKFNRLAGDSKKKVSEFDAQWYSEEIQKILQNRYLSQRAIAAVVAATLFGGGLIVYNWKTVKSEVAKESAEVSKELIESLVADAKLKKMLSVWIMELLTDLQHQIGALVVKILQQEQVITQVRKLLDNLVEYLAANEKIQKQVSDLLLKAIWLPTAQESVGKWVTSPTIVRGSQDLIQGVLASDSIQTQLAETIQTALSDASVLESARDAAWALVNPFWSKDKTLKKLTPEELVQMINKMRLSEDNKHSIATLAVSTSLSATLDALNSKTLTDEEKCRLRSFLDGTECPPPAADPLSTQQGGPNTDEPSQQQGESSTEISSSESDESSSESDEFSEETEKVLNELEKSLRSLSTALK